MINQGRLEACVRPQNRNMHAALASERSDQSNIRHQLSRVANHRWIQRGPFQQSARRRQGNEAELAIPDSDLLVLSLRHAEPLSARPVEKVGAQGRRVLGRKREQGGAVGRHHSCHRRLVRCTCFSETGHAAVRSNGAVARNRGPTKLGLEASCQTREARPAHIHGRGRDGAPADAGELVPANSPS
jgi:hypothetical protein